MDNSHHDRVSELFDRLAPLSPDERTRMLDELGEEEPDVRSEVEALLSGDRHAVSRLASLERPFETAAGPDRIGRFELGRRLGGGGMGVVYEARDERLDRTVAVKILHRGFAYDPLAKARFEREARAASRLDHPNICGIHDFGETGDGELYLVMPLYRGETLRERIARGRLSIDEVLSIALQLSAGLAEAHARDVVHRDIKPGNVLLTENGEVVILDFGLAMMSDLSHITREGSTMGTVAYMSPEQVMGEEVDARSDLWSLGVVLYEMLAGRTPFRGDHDQALIYNIRHEEPAAPSSLRADVPAALDGLVMGLLAKDPARRDAQPQAALQALADERGTPELAELQRGYRERTRRRVAVRAITGLLLLAALVVAAAWIWKAIRSGAGAVSDTPELTGRFVVLPFDVHGDSSLEYLGDGIVPLLRSRLDGLGRLRAVAPADVQEALGAYSRGAPGADSLRHLRAAVGADVVLTGDLVFEGQDVSVIAEIHVGNHTFTERVSGIQDADFRAAAVDRLAIMAAADAMGPLGDPEAGIAARTTNSLDALRAYVEGRIARLEQRASDAIDRQLEAVAYDSTFAFAWHELSHAIGEFTGSHELDVGPDMAERLEILQISGLEGGRTAAGWTLDLGPVVPFARRAAYRHSKNLPEYYRLTFEAEAADPLVRQRIYGMLATRYPDDAEALRAYGDGLVSREGRLEEGWRYLVRSARLDPDSPRPLADLTWIAMANRDAAAMDTLLPEYVRRGWFPGDARGIGDRRLLPLVQAAPDGLEPLLADLHEATFLELFWMGETLSSIGRCDLALRVASVLQSQPDWHREYGTAYFGRCRAAMGQVAGAVQFMVSSIDYLRGDNLQAMAALVSLFPYGLGPGVIEPLLEALDEWDPVEYPLRWNAAFRGHEEAHRQFLMSVVRLREGEMPDPVFVSSLDTLHSPEVHFRHILLAYSAAARGDTDAALQYLSRSSSHPGYPYGEWLRAELDFNSRAYEVALRRYMSLLVTGTTYLSDWLDSIMLLRIAECWDNLGDRRMAADYYRRFLLYWKDSEPAYRHLADRASHRLEQLTGSQ